MIEVKNLNLRREIRKQRKKNRLNKREMTNRVTVVIKETQEAVLHLMMTRKI